MVLLLEISTGRLLAPAVGVSLETWTGIIAVVLAGFAAGDALGGALVDRLPSPRLLAATLGLAGGAVAAAPFLAPTLAGLAPASSLPLRVTALAAAAMLAPSLLLGMVLPMTTRLTLRATAEAGRTAGGLSAAATTSSVAGVIVGGFFLLEHFGVRSILAGAGLALVAVAALPLLASAPDGGLRPMSPAETAVAVAPPPAPLLLAALGGAAVMMVELAAARVIAPLFGNSLYTWASVIGATLLGIGLGNAAGGRRADHNPAPGLLATALALAGCATLAVLLLPYLYSRLWPDLTRVLFGILPAAVTLPLVIGAMLLPSAVAFGMISPILIRLCLRAVSRGGNVVGRIYAAQAAGSIAGTLVTGFVLISWLGARAVILLVAEGAVVVGAVLAGRSALRPPRRGFQAAAAAAFAVTLATAVAGRIPSPCLRESNYYCIRVLEAAPGIKGLALDGLIHSYVNLQDPSDLRYEYEIGWAALLERLAAQGLAAPRTLFIGGGGYVLPRYLLWRLPGSRVEVVEIDPAVTRVAQGALGLAPAPGMRIWHEDGRQFLRRRPRARRYDLIFSDVFRDAYSIPYHLTTLEFAGLIAAALDRGGIYTVNIVDGREGRFVRSFVRTLRQVFPHVDLFPAGADWRQNVQTTYLVVASWRPPVAAQAVARGPDGKPGPLVALSSEELAAYLAAGPSIVLTDDLAPVDHFLARVYAEAVRER